MSSNFWSDSRYFGWEDQTKDDHHTLHIHDYGAEIIITINQGFPRTQIVMSRSDFAELIVRASALLGEAE